MKIAIISVSDKGQKLALNLKEQLDDDSTVLKTDIYHKNVKNGITSQKGFKYGVSGHLDVFYRKESASEKYYKNPVTIYGK